MSVWKSIANFVTGFFGVIGDGNYSQFEKDGTLILHGNATVWDDLRYPFTESKLGTLDKPDFDYTNLGLLFPQNDATEKVYIIAQLSHAIKNLSEIRPHIHWIQSQASFPTWKMDYRIYSQGSTVPGGFNTVSVNTGVFTYPGSGSILQISIFPTIDISIYGLSAMIDIIIYRDDNVVTGDVLAKEFDIHAEFDSLGSRQEFTK